MSKLRSKEELRYRKSCDLRQKETCEDLSFLISEVAKLNNLEWEDVFSLNKIKEEVIQIINSKSNNSALIKRRK